MTVQTIDSVTVRKWLDEQQAVLVDVREPGEHRSCCIVDAHLSPLGSVSLDGIDVQNKKVVIHCQKGGRGKTACDRLASRHPELELYNLEGGIMAWQAAGLAVKKSESKVIPLDRQVQLTIGSGVVAGAILASTVSPDFIWLSGFFGAGLMMAGSIGICPLARVIAKMPWNR